MASDGTSFDTDCKLMLHMDGANGGTVFTDSSASSRSFTRVSTPTTETGTVKFGTAAGDFTTSAYSIFTSGHSDFSLDGNFTVDCWVYLTAKTTTYYISGNQLDYSTPGMSFMINPDDGTQAMTLYQTGTLKSSGTGSGVWNTGQWYHCAWVRSGTTLYFFRDGTQYGSTASLVGNLGSSTSNFYVGGDGASETLTAYIDEFRYVKGTAVWTANFTPPTAAYSPFQEAAAFSNLPLLGVG